MVEQAKKTAAQDALTSQSHSQAHSSTPPKTQGASAQTDDGDKIDTMAKFDDFMRKLK
jgi:hypothetical protein